MSECAKECSILIEALVLLKGSDYYGLSAGASDIQGSRAALGDLHAHSELL